MEMATVSTRASLLGNSYAAGGDDGGGGTGWKHERGNETRAVSSSFPSSVLAAGTLSSSTPSPSEGAVDYGSRKSTLRELQSRNSDQPAGNLWQDASLDAKFQLSKRTGSWVSRTWHFTQTFSLIIIIGMSATLWAVALDTLMDHLNLAREHLTCVAGNDENDCLSYCECIPTGGLDVNATISNPGSNAGLWFGFFCWSALMLLLGLCVANLVTLTASGSGIPRMKAVLTGQHIHHFLSLRTLLAKSAGLVLVYASGIPIGREGPYVHLACCITTLLMRTPIYRRYLHSSARRIDMLTVGLATGVSAAFGTPFGGVIFAVEVVSQYFYVPNLPRMFLAALSGTFIVKMLRSGQDVSAFIALFHTDFVASTKTKIDGGAFATIISVGVVCGLLSGCFVRLVARIVKMRKQYAPDARTNFKKYLLFFAGLALVLSIFNSIVTRLFWSDLPAMRTQRSLIDKLFLPGNQLGSVMYELLGLLAVNFFLTAAAITLPVPAGLFIPVLVIGALVGRFSASAICSFQYGASAVDECVLIANYEPGVYAVVGAAAFAAGTTRAISTAVIVTEVTGQPHLLLPISLGVIAAYFVANRVSKPVYDALIEANHFPVLPKLSYKLGNSPARACMRPANATQFLTLRSTIGDAFDLLTSPLKWEKIAGSGSRSTRLVIPIVRGTDDMRIIGEVQSGALITLVDRFLGEDGAVAQARRLSSAERTFKGSQVDMGGASKEEDGVGGSVGWAEGHRNTSHSASGEKDGLGPMSLVLPFAVEDSMESDTFQPASRVKRETGKRVLLVDPCPMCVSMGATLHKVDLLFRSLRLTTLYLVDDRNTFIGTMEREDLIVLGKNFRKQ